MTSTLQAPTAPLHQQPRPASPDPAPGHPARTQPPPRPVAAALKALREERQVEGIAEAMRQLKAARVAAARAAILLEEAGALNSLPPRSPGEECLSYAHYCAVHANGHADLGESALHAWMRERGQGGGLPRAAADALLHAYSGEE